MSGSGSNHPTWEPLRKAFEAHAKESAGGDGYALVDWVMIGYVVDLEKSEDESEGGEYVMASSSNAPHIVEGILGQINLFRAGHDDDD